MKVTKTSLNGLLVIEPDVFQDERGFFLETYQSERYKAVGITEDFVQDNHSRSSKGVLRGMHFQVKHPHAQIVTVLRGCIFDVCVDLRKASPAYGQWFGIELKDSGSKQIYHAPGFAHGFCVLSDWADLHYKVSGEYDPSDESGLIWNDPEVGIKWPKIDYVISPRDLGFARFKEISTYL